MLAYAKAASKELKKHLKCKIIQTTTQKPTLCAKRKN
jgi:hypothetical protein